MKTAIRHLCLLALFACSICVAKAADAPVTLQEDATTYILDNGIVTARVAKASGDLVSLRYQGLEMLATFLKPNGDPDLERDPPGYNPNGLNPRMTDHQYGFWSHDAMGPKDTQPAVARITIDPRTNGGTRAEVSVKGISNGRKMGTGPGASADGQFVSDIEIRYTLGRGDSGVYTYSIFEHKPEYPLTALGEARFCTKLAEFFDWMSVAETDNAYFPKELKAGDKYIHTRVLFENPAYGWSSTTKKVGLYFVNASMEYISGGPTKVEFMGHRDTNAVGAPTVLNYWRSSHYGGAEVNVAAGEHWTKVIGPFLIYVNSGETPQAMYDNARARVEVEKGKWPYEWVAGIDYPLATQRTTVKGKLVLDDSSAPKPPKEFSHILVGLTAPAYVSPRPTGPTPPPIIDWQRDAKNYQFWVHGKANGDFEIPKVRPGRYTLHAIADGVLGEYVQTDITVEPGKPLDLGKLTWTPVRYGRQLWEIGIPNRNASEFFMAEKHNDPEISLKYPKLFPDDINYTIGKSDFRKDWFFQHVPHNEDPTAKSSPFYGVRAPGRATPYTISFDLAEAPKGKAILRLAICGTGAKEINISINGQPSGKIDGLTGDGVITRHGIQGIWYEREYTFSAKLLNAGKNTLTLTVPAGPVNDGMMYDYLRLELDETAPRNLFIAGDSTAANGYDDATGWGKIAGKYFDPIKISVENKSIAGRSSRTFISEGNWDQLLEKVKPGDVILIQFGHNDGAEINGERIARGSLPGLGEETQEIDNNVTKVRETVHTFGWYMRKMIADARAKEAWPVLFTITTVDYWTGDRVKRDPGGYNQLIRQIAEAEKVPLVDHDKLIADRYEQIGHEATNALFPRDHVHTSEDGALLNAFLAVSGLKGLREQWLTSSLSHAGRQVPTAAPTAMYVPPQPPPKNTDRNEREVFGKWLNLPSPAVSTLPTLWLIGDSTVRNGRGNGYDGQFGWGDPLEKYFYPSKVNVVNRAVGGTGARTFRTQWEHILPQLKPGDVVIMQFGHNDNGSKGALPGIGDETEERENPTTKQSETIHTFGWYLQQYVSEIRAKGATPIICSLVPRNRWKDGKVSRSDDSHGGWARTIAEKENIPFLDLNNRIADYYDSIGQEKTLSLFADKTTHTNWDGAVINAGVVTAALRALAENPTSGFMRPDM